MSEITTSKDSGWSGNLSFAWLASFCVVVIVYLFGLTIPLVGPDEPRYAQVAREMFDRGDWVTPTLGGFNWFEKPALLYWLEIVSYKLFGVNEFAARFGPALFGLGTILTLWFLGKSVERSAKTATNEDLRTANGLANWLALIAATTLGIIVFSRGASFDIIITFPMTAAMVSFYIFDQSKTGSFRERYLPLVLFYVFIGVALLAKGLIGIVFPFGIVGFYLVLSRRLPSRTLIFSLFWGTLLAVGIALIWYLPMYQRHGYEFIDEFIVKQHFQRFTSNKYQHPQPFYFFLWVLPLMTLPWLPFFLASVWNSVRQLFRGAPESRRRGDTLSPLFLFLIAWVLVPLVFFSLSGSKLPGYILPSVPAAIIITAMLVANLAARRRIWQRISVSLALVTLLLTVILVMTAVPQFAESDSVKGLIAAANERGYVSQRVLSLHTISHNAEFYAAGRLLRDGAGLQKRLYGVGEVKNEIDAENGAPVLVLVPLEYLTQLTNDDTIRAEVLRDNGDLAIVFVSLK